MRSMLGWTKGKKRRKPQQFDCAEGAGHMRNPFRAGNYKSDSKSLGRSDTQNGVYYFHSALLGLSRFSSAAFTIFSLKDYVKC